MEQNGRVPKLEFERLQSKHEVSGIAIHKYIGELRASMHPLIDERGATYEAELAFLEGYLQGIAACFESVQVSVSRMDPIIAPMVAQSFHGHASFIIGVAKKLRAQQKK